MTLCNTASIPPIFLPTCVKIAGISPGIEQISPVHIHPSLGSRPSRARLN